MVAFFFYRDDVPTVKVKQCGAYNLGGEKVDFNNASKVQKRYRVKVEFEFATPFQEDGREPQDGDTARAFAEVVHRLVKEGLDKQDFVNLIKPIYKGGF